jgi:hypothetical protein
MTSQFNTKNFIYFALATLVIVSFADQLQAIQSDTCVPPYKTLKKKCGAICLPLKLPQLWWDPSLR